VELLTQIPWKEFAKFFEEFCPAFPYVVAQGGLGPFAPCIRLAAQVSAPRAAQPVSACSGDFRRF
jgi:hypothetical protein